MEITFKPSKKQFLAWQYLTDQVTTELGYGGGAYGGKSYLGCFWLIAMCLAYPGTGWLMGRKELANLKRTTLVTFFKVCAEYGVISGRDFVYNQQTNTITFNNGDDPFSCSQIFLFDLAYKPSDPHYTRLGGLEITGAFIDESNEVAEKAISIISKRCGRRLNDKYGILPKVLETFNPDKGHVYANFYKPDKEGKLPDHRKFVKALPKDNPFATEQYLDQLRRGDKVTVERLYYGNFEYDDDPTVLISYDASLDLFTNAVDESDEQYLICDVARYGGDKIVAYRFEGLCLKEIWIWKKQGVDTTAQALKDIAIEYRIPYSHIIADEDGVGGGVIDILRGIKGFVANSSPIETSNTEIEENFGSLKAQCSYKLADYVNDHKIAIELDLLHSDEITSEDFKEKLLEEIGMIKSFDADKDGKRKILPKDQIKEIIGRSPDFSDTLMMRMWFELSSRLSRAGQYAHQTTGSGSMAYRRRTPTPTNLPR